MTSKNGGRKGGAANGCPALHILRGTMGHVDDDKRKPLREPGHLFNFEGRCRHCGDRDG